MEKSFISDISREYWAAGPWNDEPDRAVWVNVPTGYTCLALRNDYSLVVRLRGCAVRAPVAPQALQQA